VNNGKIASPSSREDLLEEVTFEVGLKGLPGFQKQRWWKKEGGNGNRSQE
jgi:hypothetical protein